MKKRILVIASILIILSGLLFGSYKLMNSRSFQFFGDLTSHVETDEKVVALTFDDGPTENVIDVLRLLDNYNAKATFFLIGNELEENMYLGQEIVKAGHQLGNHTYSHPRMVLKTSSFIKSEVEKTNELIRETGYDDEIHFRPPYGKKLFMLPYYLKQADMKTITWTLAPEKYYESVEDKLNYVNSNVEPGSIILMHPMYNDEELETVEGILKSLTEEGYEFVTVSELESMGESK